MSESYRVRPMPLLEFEHGFSAVERWCGELGPQGEGNPSAICEATGEPYIEFFAYGLARKGDVDIIEQHVAKQFGCAIQKYLARKYGKIYWRKRPEVERGPYSHVLRYSDDGPDFDPIWARKCYMDKNWTAIKMYCRLCAAEKEEERVA